AASRSSRSSTARRGPAAAGASATTTAPDRFRRLGTNRHRFVTQRHTRVTGSAVRSSRVAGGLPPHPGGEAGSSSARDTWAEARLRRLAYTTVLVPRNRSVRAAALGAARGRPVGPSPLSSRSASVLRRRVILAALVLVSLTLLTVYFRESSGGGLHSLQSTGSTVLRPFEVAANRVAQPFRDAANWLGGLSDAR